MSRRLNRHIRIDGTSYGPDDFVPAAVAEQILWPDIWVDDPTAQPPTEPVRDPGGGADSEPMKIPPKGGPGSGPHAWAAYAAFHNVPVPAGAKRDDIIAALDDATVPTE